MTSSNSDLTWSSALMAMLVSHAVGDVLLQTEWQAVNKVPDLNDHVARRALGSHVAAYTLAFAPALVWIGDQRTWRRAAGIAGLIALPHLAIDDGRVVGFWLRRVKRASDPPPALQIAVDQTFHVVCLLGASLAASR
jgi:hypothetical protein